MSLFNSLSSIPLFFSTLFLWKPQDSTTAYIIIWSLRLVTFSLIFRSFLGPTILRLVSRRLRVQSVSLRSIRGIYFRAGKGILHIDRVGWSYHRPSALDASRFSIRVEGFRLELVKLEQVVQPKTFAKGLGQQGRSSRLSESVPTFLHVSLVGRYVSNALYSSLEPYARPVLRAAVVAALRVMIRALPALTQVVDLEVDSAVITSPVIPGAELIARKAKINTSVVFTQLDNSNAADKLTPPPGRTVHRRFASVANFNTRVKNSFRRTWNRAWGSTQVAAALSLNVQEVLGVANGLLLREIKSTISGEFKIYGKHTFLFVPKIEFATSVRLDPRQQVERHGLDISFSAGNAELDIEVVQHILDVLKRLRQADESADNGLVDPRIPSSWSMASPQSMASPGSVASPQSAISQPPISSPPLSPRSSRIWGSAFSPTSPLMESLSARFRWHQKQPIRRLRARRATARISMLKAISVNFPSITLIHRMENQENRCTETFTANINQIRMNVSLSHPDSTSLHRQHLGRTSAPGDPLTADVYKLDFSVEKIALDRKGSGALQEHLRVVDVGGVTTTILVSQWPAPWLQGPSFLGGDPNAQFLIAQLSLGDIAITERLDIVRHLLSRRGPTKSPGPEPHPLLPPVLSPVPRMSIGLTMGEICIRLISSEGTTPFALEAKTSGFMVSVDTSFQILPDHRFGKMAPDSDRPRLHMQINLHAELHQTFLHVHRSESSLDDPLPTSTLGGSVYPGEPVLSLDTVQVIGKGYAFGELADGARAGEGITIDVPSTFLDVSCASEALSVEMWQPDAMAAIKTVLTVLADATPPSPPPTSAPAKYLLSGLPSGLAASIAVGRFMVFLAGPDLAPGEDLNISRGVAFHTGVGLHYCSLRDQHCKGLGDLIPRTQKRLQLSLATELLSTAAGGTGAATVSQSERAMIQVDAWDTALRDALATRYVADDPFGVGDISEDYRAKEYLRVEQVTIGIALSGRRSVGTPVAGSKDDCAISILVSHMRGSIHLAHAYNLLLAAQALKSILPPPKPKLKVNDAPSTLTTVVQCKFDKIQILWKFPLRMKLYMRVTGLSVHKHHSGKLTARWDDIILSVPITVERDGGQKTTWEELARLLRFAVDIHPDVKPISIIAEGQSARLRVPFDYVLADLILDINVTLKSMKHLLHMVPSGQFYNPHTPEAEDAKIVPNISLRLGCLCAEAADEPFETQLSLIWRTGYEAARLRLEREEAFEAKVAAIQAAARSEPSTPAKEVGSEFQFSAEHSVPIEDARSRLNQVHSGTWLSRLRQARVNQTRRYHTINAKLQSATPLYDGFEDEFVPLAEPAAVPPLLRMKFDDLNFKLNGPSFTIEGLPEYLHKEGGGMPMDMEYSLLIPMHLNFAVSALSISCREYPLPMLNIPAHSDKSIPGLIFDSDVVIAEEMGTEESVEWVDCAIVRPHRGLHGALPLCIAVPKTIMPVKTYADPLIRVITDEVSDFAWGVSYGPATQDIMRVMDTLSHAPRDSSPPVGFWDKVSSTDPNMLRGTGPGFALCWEGNPELLINHKNEQNELIQMLSESMMIVVPKYNISVYLPSSDGPSRLTGSRKARRSRNVCAKFGAGSRFGVGFVLERTCNSACEECSGDAFHRQCRFFDFKPHYEVRLEKKAQKPLENSDEDSYAGFRSHFIHLSISLTSALDLSQPETKCSSIHLSPAVFAHFWSWWQLFEGKSLPIRQGRRYKHKRPISPKFGQHLATIKYRIDVPRLFLSHVYMDQGRDAWADGVTPFVGIKAFILRFQADMHQRAQESTINKPDGTTKTIVHKPFYAVEVVLTDMELKTVLAIFHEPLKQRVPLEPMHTESGYRTREGIPTTEAGSPWIDLDDFTDTSWAPMTDNPTMHHLLAASCPRFTYFKRAYPNEMKDRIEETKFGDEDTHMCFLGKEASVPRIQMNIASDRMDKLRQETANSNSPCTPNITDPLKPNVDTEYMISLLQDYVNHLHTVDAQSQSTLATGPTTYYMPADSVSPEEWAQFDNVYQLHCPNIFMDNIIRDIMMQYWDCSRSRRGFEYHMATRYAEALLYCGPASDSVTSAVKFIRDQALATAAALGQEDEHNKYRGAAAAGAQAAAHAVLKILGGGDQGPRTSVEVPTETMVEHVDSSDPLKGWSEGVSLRKAHFCLLLKPQIVLRSETNAEAVCVLAAVQGKLQSYHILDDANVDDPINGRVMNRNFASITGLQAFSPSALNTSGQGVVPLEVLIDLKCGTNFFDRLVPQTDATLQYDKFNRLRLQNNVNSMARRSSDSYDQTSKHLESQNDLVRIHVPRFTVTANDRHFQAISNIVTNLLLFSDAAHKTRAERLEKMLFAYDFTNLASTADVIEKLQARLRVAVETRREAEWRLQGRGELGEVEKLKIEAHIKLLAEELDYVFEAIKLAQDKADGLAAQKSALLLHASSSEISWRMIDRHDQLLAKLAMRNIDFRWLNRQDSSAVNNLTVGDMQAFDGAADAEWTEILSKYDDPPNHPLVKRKLFCVAEWVVLPPVGGITIYQNFELTLHPMRLQIDTRVGRRIMEYLWPARRSRANQERAATDPIPETPGQEELPLPPSSPSSPVTYSSPLPAVTSFVRSPTMKHSRRASADIPSPTRSDTLAVPGLRKTAASRSFTDLRGAANGSLQVPKLHKTRSTDALMTLSTSGSSGNASKSSDETKSSRRREADDAALMKTRSSQKTFVLVRVSSIAKEDSFLFRDARIQTRDLEYRNQTWSFEELVDQFIPSGKNWKGWVKIAFQQPLIPVLPVAREIISKTKLVSRGNNHHADFPKRPKVPRENSIIPKRLRTMSTHATKSKRAPYAKERNLSALGLTTDSESTFMPDETHLEHHEDGRHEGRVKRQLLKVFGKGRRSKSQARSSMDSNHSTSSASRREDSSDVVSLRGSAENVEYRGDSRRMGRIGSALNFHEDGDDGLHHEDDIVEHLDVIDPAIATVSTLTNAANAIVFPPLDWYSRKCTVVLPDLPKRSSRAGGAEEGQVHEDNLDRHVEDVLSKRDKFRRIMQGVWAFMKTLFWGAGIVVFLAKIINVHNANTQGFWVELCQQIETGLFTATSIGLIPFRVLDTWRISRIWRYRTITIKRRTKAGLPDLYDDNDLPDPLYDENHVHVLNDKEQADLHYLNDMRPAWTTATTLPAAFVAGILAGVFIWWGGKKTRRHEQVEQRLRAALAAERSSSDPSPTENSPRDLSGIPESSPTTATSTPTLTMRGPPRSKDFVEGDDDANLGGELHRRDGTEKMPSIYEDEKFEVPGREDSVFRDRKRSDATSAASVAIVDQMTVPLPENLHSQARSQ
ncbi:hypothetical protein PHLGIDRAFT_22173 [Phlebiopsis gigantea 11061_1 CR5-6]|uniref:FMP27 GFWDK domain-containing protein n=1 Tax=Phlebiopsis gigantea (strain 11061_1 CR5-6) TaxID=745531 RepID=A0A0C3PTB1_PHLG1|nr:hypothetical protein PHLGIDRAFT_22173 [Phlebiopsis gigantea 11061_1 CR5-6]